MQSLNLSDTSNHPNFVHFHNVSIAVAFKNMVAWMILRYTSILFSSYFPNRWIQANHYKLRLYQTSEQPLSWQMSPTGLLMHICYKLKSSGVLFIYIYLFIILHGVPWDQKITNFILADISRDMANGLALDMA